MTLDNLKDALKMAVPVLLAAYNYFRSAKKTDVDDLRRRLSVLERAFTDLFSLTQEFLDELDLLVDGLPSGLRPTFRTHIALFRTTLNRMRERLHDDAGDSKGE